MKHTFYTGVTPTDVTYKITHTGKEGRRPEEKHISKKEMQMLLEVLESDIKFTVSRYMLLLQASTGARLGEIMAVTFDSINFEKKTLRIDKSWDYKYTKDFKNTKNKVHRVIDLYNEIIQRLEPFYNYKRKQSLIGIIKIVRIYYLPMRRWKLFPRTL